MRRSLPLGLFVPGNTLLHRLPAGWKLVALVLIGVAVVAARGPWWPTAAFAISLAVAVGWVRMGARALVRTLRPIVVVMGVATVFQWWARGWPTAVEVLMTVLAMVVFSAVLTATTATDELLDAVVRGLQPFRRVGVNPDAVALAISLMLTAIPAIFAIFGDSLDAARARGLSRDPRATLAPTAIRVVAHAQATGDALAARGLGDD